MKKSNLSQHGFSLIELLITIVVVAILASVTVNAYSGVQQRSRDSRRLNDMSAITKALEMYKIQTGGYPPASTTNNIVGSGWEVSSINPSQFLSALKTTGIISTIPVDPVNTDTTNQYGLIYKYYLFTAGENGCDVARGPYYVLAMGKAESTPTSLASSPGFQCSGRDFRTNHGWVTGGYTK